jgi:hypothetical protein
MSLTYAGKEYLFKKQHNLLIGKAIFIFISPGRCTRQAGDYPYKILLTVKAAVLLVRQPLFFKIHLWSGFPWFYNYCSRLFNN